MHDSTQALRGKKLLLVGFTLFSMFFGAGNLIFPPFLGAQAGTALWLAFAGFAVSAIGLPIAGDDFYPRIQTRPYDDFSQPLQLVARMLRFTDPITGEKREFVSRVPLKI